MSSLAVMADERRPASRSRTATRFVVEIGNDWSLARATWSGAETKGSLTPFQSRVWLDAWFDTHLAALDAEPVLVRVSDAATGDLALSLPLIARRRNGVSVIEFADAEITDYNGPVLGPAAPTDGVGAALLWRAVRSALPRADLLDLRKMPLVIEGRPNPLTLISTARPSPVNGNLVVVDGEWDTYHRGLEKPVRKELERSWRVFSKAEGARFVQIDDPAQAQHILEIMESQQRARMIEAGNAYILDRPENLKFYRELVATGLATGDAVLTALMAGDEVVAALLGVRRKADYVMIRISNSGGEWSNCSPGRLVIHQTMAHLKAQGVTSFDFSIGNYAYKRRFGLSRLPLMDLIEALSWRGWPAQLKARAVDTLRQNARLDGFLRRLLRRPTFTEKSEL